ncbi:MAG TPA: hypothetical protein DCQ98_01720 [Planctomycetaceae bacterium]|nr:hypothetical protein [Planctomycetaceae bacterium]
MRQAYRMSDSEGGPQVDDRAERSEAGEEGSVDGPRMERSIIGSRAAICPPEPARNAAGNDAKRPTDSPVRLTGAIDRVGRSRRNAVSLGGKWRWSRLAADRISRGR